MKEITNIHLAKTPFRVEVEAKHALGAYLASIQQRMHAEPEAMREIEARMVELLAERGVTRDGVVTAEDVTALRRQMGEPREFASDAAAEEDDAALRDAAEAASAGGAPKQLMRDTDHAVIGGVCAGVAAYFGVSPLWIRLLAIISPFMTFGTAMLIYIVMWLSVPPAVTASDKLRMAGKPVTFDSLKKAAAEPAGSSQAAQTAAKVLRIMIGCGVLMMALGAVVALIVGGVISAAAISRMGDFAAQGWLWLAYGCAVLGGVALTALLSLGAWSIFAWRLKRPVGIAMLAMLLVGAIAVSGLAVGGMNAGMSLERQMRDVQRTKVVDLADASTVRVDGTTRASYGGYAEKPRIEVDYLQMKGVTEPTVTVAKDGSRAIVTVQHDTCRDRYDIFSACTYSPKDYVSVRVYGPSPQIMEADHRPDVVTDRP
mgnify:FL=1